MSSTTMTEQTKTNQLWKAIGLMLIMLAVAIAVRSYIVTLEVPTEDGFVVEALLVVQHVLTLTPVATFFAVARNLQGYLFNVWKGRPVTIDYDIHQYYTTWLKFEAGVLIAVPIIEALIPAISNVALITACVIFAVDTVRSAFSQILAK